ncbi:glycosyltransferase family 4 protein [Thermomonas haemolytica]|uniref:Phosphatidylinositol alpha-1,6-mannosyltransferase n=1 Tax=Thermomonas haemolytica TaxID=141949 RepID=A0A4R3NC68_9GAMM|nr:glycosyltransferase family 4 protein [Thermomonas haemolytica]TCT24699.1 phosphatidylinositol alpha-1,6-mannosyltransferase [Thermomonas haemolytica]TNY29646.1 glycosyl transferase [Thermomonas haemolytica]
MGDNASLPRILHITRNLPPLVGGMERLNWHIADELSRQAQVQVIGPRGAAALKPANVELSEVPLRPLPRFLLTSAWRALRLARRQHPQLVLAGSGLTAPAAWLAARACGARAAVYVHGLDVAVRHPVYRMLWHPVLRRMDVVVANSHPTKALVRGIGVSPEKIRVVPPGVSLPEAPQSPEALRAFRERHGLGDARLLLSIGRLTTRKGLREFVRESLPAIISQAPDVLLVVIGDAPTDSLLAGVQSPESIQAEADAAGIGAHLRFLGVITDPQQLACAYEAASVHVFPVREIPGDPEGFGMVAIEAAAHGLPTVAFATGGVVDAVEDGVTGRLVPPGDYDGLRDGALAVLRDGEGAWRMRAQDFARQFVWPRFGSALRACLRVGDANREVGR